MSLKGYGSKFLEYITESALYSRFVYHWLSKIFLSSAFEFRKVDYDLLIFHSRLSCACPLPESKPAFALPDHSHGWCRHQ